MVYFANNPARFFTSETHGKNIPVEAVQITVEQHIALLDAMSSGMEVSIDENGQPVVSDPPAPAVDQIVAGYESELQKVLDAGARSWGYDDIRSAISYVGDPFPRFNAEAIALRKWRSDVWVWAGMEEAAIKAGSKPLPTPVEQFVAQMPSMPARPV